MRADVSAWLPLQAFKQFAKCSTRNVQEWF